MNVMIIRIECVGVCMRGGCNDREAWLCVDVECMCVVGGGISCMYT